VITTSSGLWRYELGDTLMFSSIAPHLFTITGRIKAFINAFGEELVVENAELAIARTCKELNCSVIDYTAGPRPESMENSGHEWCIEFEDVPENLELFQERLDLNLKKTNGDYEAKRQSDIIMKLPTINVMPKGTFYRWLQKKGRLGGQHKVPRLSNNRELVDALLKINSSRTS